MAWHDPEEEGFALSFTYSMDDQRLGRGGAWLESFAEAAGEHRKPNLSFRFAVSMISQQLQLVVAFHSVDMKHSENPNLTTIHSNANPNQAS